MALQNSHKIRICFYCKQSFQSASFHAHLKQCPQRQPPPSMFGMNRNVNRNANNNNDNNAKESYWECESCTFVNSIMSGSCKICSNPQPRAPSPPSPEDNDKKSNNNNMGGAEAQEPDDATAALIAQMMAAELCCQCKKK
eukprot:120179_1